MDLEVRAVALDFVEERFPSADLVVVGGSAARERRPRSDIDLLVVGPPTMFPAGHDEAAWTERCRSELLEVFACTPEAFRRHQRAGAARFRPVSAFLLTEGESVLDHGRSDELVAWTHQLVDAGPDVSAAELDARRYGVTNALDDLLDADEPVEQAVLAGALFVRLAESVLLAHGRWIASVGWLLRRPHQVDAEYADALGLALAERDVRALKRLALRGLAPHGGRLLEGCVR